MHQTTRAFTAFDKLAVAVEPLADGRFALTIHNPYSFELRSESASTVKLNAYLLEGERIIKEKTVINALTLHPGETLLDTLDIDLNVAENRFHLRFGVQTEDLPPTINSNRLTLSAR
jgi:hypothetical protein